MSFSGAEFSPGSYIPVNVHGFLVNLWHFLILYVFPDLDTQEQVRLVLS